MSAYVISDVEILDSELIAAYRALAQESIAKYGGRYLARGGVVEAIEGGWNPKTLIIVEFPDMARARAWYHSPDYAEALKIRERALDRRLIFVEGLPPTAKGEA
ncbi:MAG TPA: DUF1330 domain-containing protein [Dongiaceae bacterium]|nr:DUF1330 domain-containing protein [Dongiaceae bacterium]